MVTQRRSYRGIDEAILKRAIELLDAGHSARAAARIMKVDPTTLYFLIRKLFPHGRGGYERSPLRSRDKLKEIPEEVKNKVKEKWSLHLQHKTTVRELASRYSVTVYDVRKIIMEEK